MIAECTPQMAGCIRSNRSAKALHDARNFLANQRLMRDLPGRSCMRPSHTLPYGVITTSFQSPEMSSYGVAGSM